MSAPAWSRDPAARIALGAATLGLIAVAWALASAVRVESLSAGSARTITSLEATGAVARRAPVDVSGAIDNDVFAPDRSPPSVRYHMPNESRGSEEPAAEPEKPAVLGTAVATDGRSFATLKMGDGNPTLVRIGDRIGEWTVRSIERGKVVLVSANGVRANLAVPKPGT